MQTATNNAAADTLTACMRTGRPAIWLALWPRAEPVPADEGAASPQISAAAPLQSLAWWALQFSPKVCLLEDAVLLELSSCLRLFGGLRRMHRRIQTGLAQVLRPQCPDLPPVQAAWGRSAHAALALARAGVPQALDRPTQRLDSLPLTVLSALQAHRAMLLRIGCRTLGDVRRLPRSGLARRFGPALLQALDQAYGEHAEAHVWVQLPDVFDSRLELPYRIEHAQALLTHAQPLLMRLSEWLIERHAGVDQLCLQWRHDAMRARDIGPGGELPLHLAQPCRDAGHLLRLLAEHLARQTLHAPVAELRLRAEGIRPLPASTPSLLWDDHAAQTEVLPQLLERLSARLGPQQVRRGQIQADHRPEHMQHWQDWQSQATSRSADRSVREVARRPLPDRPATPASLRHIAQPSWLLSPPLRLSTQQDQPVYQGLLQILLGPQRLEGGWWGLPSPSRHGLTHGASPSAEPQMAASRMGASSASPTEPSSEPLCLRDYYLAHSPAAGLLWIFVERRHANERHWYLHGIFA